ncbi:hypothetical protein PFZ55_23930 [Streptomyces sp. MS2A]|nr:hypothetical protein [Streptomyces sp. MS2A]
MPTARTVAWVTASAPRREDVVQVGGFAVPSRYVPVVGVNNVSPSSSRCTGRTA